MPPGPGAAAGTSISPAQMELSLLRHHAQAADRFYYPFISRKRHVVASTHRCTTCLQAMVLAWAVNEIEILHVPCKSQLGCLCACAGTHGIKQHHEEGYVSNMMFVAASHLQSCWRS